MASSSLSARSINVSEAPTVVKWTCAEGRVRFLSHPDPSHPTTLDIRFDAPTSSAFFKLRVPVLLKALPRTRTSVFVFVHPERILSLAYDDCNEVPELVGENLRAPITRLRFSLRKPAVLVVPAVPLVPKKKPHGDVLDSLRMLVRETDFDVYLSSWVLSKRLLSPLCEAIFAQSLKSAARDADLASLYGGQGGKAIEGGDLDVASAANDEPRTESPPSYDELGPTPQPVPANIEPDSGNPSKKRRRGSSDASKVNRKYIEEVCREMMDSRKGELRGQIIAEVNLDIRDQLDEMEMRIIARMEQRLSETAEELRQELSGLQEELEGQIEEAKEEMDDIVDLRIDQQMLGIKDELQTYVDEELKSVEERIKDDISAATISLQFD